jgi:CubicO group peptidase (beta-lactamase class C family)
LDRPLAEYTRTHYGGYGMCGDLPGLRTITARQVLSHSAGFGNWEDDRIGKLSFVPGSQFHYSGEGYIYLQSIVEQIVSADLHAWTRRTIFEPLGLRDSAFAWTKECEGRVAIGYGERDRNVGRRWPQAYAAYSLYTTPTDYARLILAMMSDATSSAVVAEMFEPQISISASVAWGLGWGLQRTRSDEAFWHWGDLGDSQCFAIFSRRARRGLVIMTNSGNGMKTFEAIVEDVIGGSHPCFKEFLDQRMG